MFESASRLRWDEVQEIAEPFGSMIQEKWPSFYDEMRGEIVLTQVRAVLHSKVLVMQASPMGQSLLFWKLWHSISVQRLPSDASVMAARAWPGIPARAPFWRKIGMQVVPGSGARKIR